MRTVIHSTQFGTFLGDSRIMNPAKPPLQWTVAKRPAPAASATVRQRAHDTIDWPETMEGAIGWLETHGAAIVGFADEPLLTSNWPIGQPVWFRQDLPYVRSLNHEHRDARWYLGAFGGADWAKVSMTANGAKVILQRDWLPGIVRELGVAVNLPKKSS